MRCEGSKLQFIGGGGGANGIALCTYGAKSVHDVVRPGYFDDMVVSTGDHIIVSAPDGGAHLLVTRGGKFNLGPVEVLPLAFAATPVSVKEAA